jgi:hypothetical protein
MPRLPCSSISGLVIFFFKAKKKLETTIFENKVFVQLKSEILNICALSHFSYFLSNSLLKTNEKNLVNK